MKEQKEERVRKKTRELDLLFEMFLVLVAAMKMMVVEFCLTDFGGGDIGSGGEREEVAET